jgi:Cd(II)/Pb(II)-responsive transcriptional regulator
MKNQLKIGALAERTGCLVETIRYYEGRGLLPVPTRSEGNYRLYADEHVERLQFIRRCRSLDMTLDEIQTLLMLRDAPEQECGGVNALLDEHIGHVTTRVAELMALEKQLKKLRRLCGQVQQAKNCGILNELGADPAVASKTTQSKRTAHRSHIPGPHHSHTEAIKLAPDRE